MKARLACLCMLALVGVMLTSSASEGSSICAGSLYCNGEVNGSIDAWTINFGYSVSNSFTLASAGTVKMASFGVWNFTGDSGGSVDWKILTGGPDTSAGGTVIASGTAAGLTTLDLGTNKYGYDLQVDSFNLSKALAAGTYYLELSNAAVTSGNPVYWDENDGPLGNGTGSVAWESALGYLNIPGGCSNSNNGNLTSGYCSESFAVYTTSTVPEPGTLALLASGLLCAIGVMRRKLMR